MVRKNKTVHGWGVNDVDYPVQRKATPKWVCPYYEDWKGMIQRCFDKKFQDRNPAYKDCTVYDEWKYLSNFIKWVDSQPNRGWIHCSLDKDLLSSGNKYYHPETCVYIPLTLNNFINVYGEGRGQLMLGVSKVMSPVSPSKSQCCDPFKIRRDDLGVFKTEIEAHKAWQQRKHEYACQLAALQQDIRVVDVLQRRYAPDKDWSNV